MADTGIFATTAEILRKAGVGASTAASDEAYTNDFIYQAECFINVLTRKNYSATGTYAALTAGTKGILKEAAANLAAIYVIQYDMNGYKTLRHGENIININWARFVQCIGLLKDQNAVTFIG